MGTVLALQFYFFNRAQKEMMSEVGRFIHSFNSATDSYYLDVAENLERFYGKEPVGSPGRPPAGLRWKGAFPQEKETEVFVRKIPPGSGLRPTMPPPPDGTFLNDQKVSKMWRQLRKIEESKNNIEKKVKLYRQKIGKQIDSGKENWEDERKEEDSLKSDKILRTWKITDSTQNDSLIRIVEKVDIDLNGSSRDQNGDHSPLPVPAFPDRPPKGARIFTIQIPDFSLPDAPRLVRYRFSTARMESALVATRNRNIFITILLSLLSIAVIWVVSRRSLKPIASLKKSFDDVINGNLDSNIPEETRDEIGDLTHSFNQMVGELRKNRDKEIILQRKERLASVGQLAAGVAHEIKNPLNAINLTIEHLKDKFTSKQESQVQKYIQTIQNEIKRLDDIVNNFLSFVRSENLQTQETDLNDLISSVVDLFSREMEVRKIKIVSQLGTPFLYPVDLGRFKTVLMNLILNAIQAMPGGGTLTVKSDPESKTIFIIDTGVGIPEKELENIFDIFYTTKASGTGLGLPTAYKIVKAHGGDLFISSKPGKGTRVEIRFETI